MHGVLEGLPNPGHSGREKTEPLYPYRELFKMWVLQGGVQERRRDGSVNARKGLNKVKEDVHGKKNRECHD